MAKDTHQETYLDRIKKCKSEQRITNDKLSEMTGIPLGTLSKLLAGINDSPRLCNVVAIAEALGCSLDYLIMGKPENKNNYTLEDDEIAMVQSFRALDSYGRSLVLSVLSQEQDRAVRQCAERDEMIRQRERDQTAYRTRKAMRGKALETVATEAVGVASSDTAPKGIVLTEATEMFKRRSIPLYDLPVSAGVGEFLSESQGEDIWIPKTQRTDKAKFALRISGDSMEPKYRSGDVLLIEETPSVAVGELGIFVLDGMGYFKEYAGNALRSLNPAYAPIMLKDFERVECYGRVVGKLKRK